MRKIVVAIILLLLLLVMLEKGDPAIGPPPPWRHMRDTPAIVDGDRAWCVTDGTIVEPGGVFCTSEGIDLE